MAQASPPTKSRGLTLLLLAWIRRGVSIRRRIVCARVLRIVGRIVLVGLRIRTVAGWIASQRARVRAARSRAVSAYGDAIFHAAIARERTRDAMRRLLFFSRLHSSTQLDSVISNVHAERIVAQRGLVLQRILNLALQGGGVVDANAGGRHRRCCGRACIRANCAGRCGLSRRRGLGAAWRGRYRAGYATGRAGRAGC